MNIQANELAERLHVQPSAVSNWTNGLNAVGGRRLRELGEVLKVDPNWLIGRVGSDDEPMLIHEPPAPYSVREPERSEAAQWKERALAAESKLNHISSVLGSLIQLAKPESAEQASAKPERIAGVNSSAVSSAARGLAASAAAKVFQESSQRREADEPSVKKPEPKPGVEKG